MRINFLIAFLILILNTPVKSQDIVWENTIGGSADDYLTSIVKVPTGGYLIGGYSNSNISGDKSENSQGLSDFWIIRLDNNGAIIWQNTIGGNGDDKLKSTIATNDGYLLAGNTGSVISGDKTAPNFGGIDYWIVKIDTSGNIIWQQTYGGSNNENLTSIVQCNDGGFLIGGDSKSDSTGMKNEDSKGGDDFWIVKIDSVGNYEWQNTIGGNDNDWLISVQHEFSSGYLLAGTTISTLSSDISVGTLDGYNDYWFVQVDSSGNIIYEKTLNEPYDQLAYNACIDSSNKILICGESWFNGCSNNDFQIKNYDYITQTQNNLIFGANDEDWALAINKTNDDGYLILGRTNSDIGCNKTEDLLGNFDFWIIKLDSLFNIVWQNTIGGSNNDIPSSIANIGMHSYVIGGYTDSNTSSDKSENCLGGMDFWVIEIVGKEDYNHVTGKAFIDLNSDNNQDIGENSIPNLKIIDSVSQKFSFTNNFGDFDLDIPPSGPFQINSIPTSNYFIPVPLTHSGIFYTSKEIDSLNNFSFQPNGVYNDLCVELIPKSAMRSGFHAYYEINFGNYGTTVQNGTIIFYPDSNISFISADILPLSISSDSIIFDISSLQPYQFGKINIEAKVDSGLTIGSIVTSNVTILPIAGDANPICNINTSIASIIGSFDPNDILVNRSTLYDYELSTEPYLEYLIRFQNTGNDTAFNVRILDHFEQTSVQPLSFEIISSSHPVEFRYLGYENNFEFLFKDIILPDSSTNNSLSNGYIKFKIKPVQNLFVGDVILNFATIYFDHNDGINTNFVSTLIIAPLGNENLEDEKINIFPIPAKDQLTLKLADTETELLTIEIINILGESVSVIHFNTFKGLNKLLNIDISKFPEGVYIVKVTGQNGFCKKFIKH